MNGVIDGDPTAWRLRSRDRVAPLEEEATFALVVGTMEGRKCGEAHGGIKFTSNNPFFNVKEMFHFAPQ